MAEYIEREMTIRAVLNDYPEQVGYSREDAADCIRNMVASDVSQVRHGRWIDKEGYAVCTECGNDVRLKWDVSRDGYTIYCPYCGYRMKLCSMCDILDGGKCDWSSDTGKCKNDKIGRTTEAAEPQPDGIQFRTVDDLGRICLPKDIRDKLGIKPGTECAVCATDELTSEQIIVIRRK